MKEEIKKVLNEARPNLQMHGGDLDFVGFKDRVVKIRFKGACVGCPLSEMTLKGGIEEILKQKIHGIEKVEAVE